MIPQWTLAVVLPFNLTLAIIAYAKKAPVMYLALAAADILLAVFVGNRVIAALGGTGVCNFLITCRINELKAMHEYPYSFQK